MKNFKTIKHLLLGEKTPGIGFLMRGIFFSFDYLFFSCTRLNIIFCLFHCEDRSNLISLVFPSIEFRNLSWYRKLEGTYKQETPNEKVCHDLSWLEKTRKHKIFFSPLDDSPSNVENGKRKTKIETCTL
jgi:hypothetical protein